MKRPLVWRVVNVLAYLGLLVVNILANTLPLNGLNTGELSDRFDVYFVPAGYVFSIWGLIYLGLGAYAVYQVAANTELEPRLSRIDVLFPLSCIANVAWLFLWHYEVFVWTLAAMFGLLLALIGIYTRLGIGRQPVGRSGFWAVHAPFSLYLGWISVATIANVSQMLDFVGWAGWGIAPEMWAVVMLLTAAALASVMVISRADFVYPLVIIWAAVGIAVEQVATPAVTITAWAVAGFTLFMLPIAFITRRRRSLLPAA